MPIDMDRRAAIWELNPQLDSILFSALPAEIRREIFAYILAPKIYTYNKRKFRHDFRITQNHDGDPDDDIREELEHWHQAWSSSPVSLAEAFESWDTDLYLHWKGPKKYHPDPYRRLRPQGESSCPTWYNTFTSERPGYTGRPVLRPKILLVCRRAYAEARSVIFETQERCFWMFDTHPHPRQRGRGGFVSMPLEWTEERRRWERKFTTIHLLAHTQFIRWAIFPEQRFLSRVEHLRLTIRDCDWREIDGPEFRKLVSDRAQPVDMESQASHRRRFPWDRFYFENIPLTETDSSPMIDPFIRELVWGPTPSLGGRGFDWIIKHRDLPGEVGWPPNQDWVLEMLQASGNGSFGGEEIAIEGANGTPKRRPSWVPPSVSFVRGAWGREFINMPRIKTFTMTFDACEAERDVASAFVDWAIRAWRFPLNPKRTGYHYLSAAGNPIRQMSWRGTRSTLTHYCRYCNSPLNVNWGYMPSRPLGRTIRCEAHCWRAAERYLMNLGFRIYSWTVTWTPRRHDDPQENAIPLQEYVERADYDLDDDGDDSLSDEKERADKGES